jgi:hypothetical protein
MMRFLAPFLALIVLSLSLIPCSDKMGVSDTANVETHSDHSGSHIEDCTPFCTCSCCSTSVVFSPEAIVIAKVPLQLSQNSFFYQEGESFFSHSIWQPPKI